MIFFVFLSRVSHCWPRGPAVFQVDMVYIQAALFCATAKTGQLLQLIWALDLFNVGFSKWCKVSEVKPRVHTGGRRWTNLSKHHCTNNFYNTVQWIYPSRGSCVISCSHVYRCVLINHLKLNYKTLRVVFIILMGQCEHKTAKHEQNVKCMNTCVGVRLPCLLFNEWKQPEYSV